MSESIHAVLQNSKTQNSSMNQNHHHAGEHGAIGRKQEGDANHSPQSTTQQSSRGADHSESQSGSFRNVSDESPLRRKGAHSNSVPSEDQEPHRVGNTSGINNMNKMDSQKTLPREAAEKDGTFLSYRDNTDSGSNGNNLSVPGSSIAAAQRSPPKESPFQTASYAYGNPLPPVAENVDSPRGSLSDAPSESYSTPLESPQFKPQNTHHPSNRDESGSASQRSQMDNTAFSQNDSHSGGKTQRRSTGKESYQDTTPKPKESINTSRRDAQEDESHKADVASKYSNSGSTSQRGSHDRDPQNTAVASNPNESGHTRKKSQGKDSHRQDAVSSHDDSRHAPQRGLQGRQSQDTTNYTSSTRGSGNTHLRGSPGGEFHNSHAASGQNSGDRSQQESQTTISSSRQSDSYDSMTQRDSQNSSSTFTSYGNMSDQGSQPKESRNSMHGRTPNNNPISDEKDSNTNASQQVSRDSQSSNTSSNQNDSYGGTTPRASHGKTSHGKEPANNSNPTQNDSYGSSPRRVRKSKSAASNQLESQRDALQRGHKARYSQDGNVVSSMKDAHSHISHRTTLGREQRANGTSTNSRSILNNSNQNDSYSNANRRPSRETQKGKTVVESSQGSLDSSPARSDDYQVGLFDSGENENNDNARDTSQQTQDPYDSGSDHSDHYHGGRRRHTQVTQSNNTSQDNHQHSRSSRGHQDGRPSTRDSHKAMPTRDHHESAPQTRSSQKTVSIKADSRPHTRDSQKTGQMEVPTKKRELYVDGHSLNRGQASSHNQTNNPLTQKSSSGQTSSRNQQTSSAHRSSSPPNTGHDSLRTTRTNESQPDRQSEQSMWSEGSRAAGQTTASSVTSHAPSSREGLANFFGSEIFHLVLRNPTTAHQLLKFCQNRGYGENMEFLEKIEAYNRQLDTVTKLLAEIHSTFTAPDSPKSLHLPPSVAKRMIADVRQATNTTLPALENMFAPAQDHVESTLASDIYPRFVKHQVTLSAAGALSEGRSKYQGLGDCFCLTDPKRADNPILWASDGFVSTTGYSRNEIVPRNCRFLQGDQTDKLATRRLKMSIDNAEETVELLLNYRKNGDPFWNLLYVAPLVDARGLVSFFLGGQINCSTTISRNVDVLKVLSLNNDEANFRLKDKDRPSNVRQNSAGMASEAASSRNTFFRSFRRLTNQASSDSMGVRKSAGMEGELLDKAGKMSFRQQIEAFYTAYSKYLVLAYNPKETTSMTISHYSPSVIDLLCLHLPNGAIAPVYGKDIFKVLGDHATDQAVPKRYKTTVKESIAKGKAVSLDLGLLTGVVSKKGWRGHEAKVQKAEEKYVTHWTPLKDEEARTGYIVLTISPK